MERKVEISLYLHFREDALTWNQSLDYFAPMKLPDEELEKLLLNRWSHVGKQDKENTKGLFSCENLYCRFMDVFIKKISLFLLTPVVGIILSMFTWLIDCKLLQRIFKAHRLRVKIFKSLNI
jgi:hypothetical protein